MNTSHTNIAHRRIAFTSVLTVLILSLAMPFIATAGSVPLVDSAPAATSATASGGLTPTTDSMSTDSSGPGEGTPGVESGYGQQLEAFCQEKYGTSCLDAGITSPSIAAKDMDESKCRDESGGMSCEEKAQEEQCQKTYHMSCDNVNNQMSGSAAKLDLKPLTLDSNGQKTGASFHNNEYAQYGLVVGTIFKVVDIMMLVIGSFSFLTLIVAGTIMIINHGDEAWVTKGKGMIFAAIIGLIVAIISFAIVQVIQSALS